MWISALYWERTRWHSYSDSKLEMQLLPEKYFLAYTHMGDATYFLLLWLPHSFTYKTTISGDDTGTETVYEIVSLKHFCKYSEDFNTMGKELKKKNHMVPFLHSAVQCKFVSSGPK